MRAAKPKEWDSKSSVEPSSTADYSTQRRSRPIGRDRAVPIPWRGPESGKVLEWGKMTTVLNSHTKQAKFLSEHRLLFGPQAVAGRNKKYNILDRVIGFYPSNQFPSIELISQHF